MEIVREKVRVFAHLLMNYSRPITPEDGVTALCRGLSDFMVRTGTSMVVLNMARVPRLMPV